MFPQKLRHIRSSSHIHKHIYQNMLIMLYENVHNNASYRHPTLPSNCGSGSQFIILIYKSHLQKMRIKLFLREVTKKNKTPVYDDIYFSRYLWKFVSLQTTLNQFINLLCITAGQKSPHSFYPSVCGGIQPLLESIEGITAISAFAADPYVAFHLKEAMVLLYLPTFWEHLANFVPFCSYLTKNIYS